MVLRVSGVRDMSPLVGEPEVFPDRTDLSVRDLAVQQALYPPAPCGRSRRYFLKFNYVYGR
jgi:hypothetical protein